MVDAELDFGENLSEDTLASAFEVSRTPVREALNLLQMEGLVIIVPKSGTYVFTPTLEDIAELCDYRVGLEKQAIALTPQESLPLAVSELQKQLQAMTEAIDRGDMQAYGRADTAFHLAFFHHCGNRYLKNAYDLILGRVASLRTHLAIRAEGEPDRSYKDHAHMISLFAENKRDRLFHDTGCAYSSHQGQLSRRFSKAVSQRCWWKGCTASPSSGADGITLTSVSGLLRMALQRHFCFPERKTQSHADAASTK
ncbi:GntR family transcriptional regulator [Brucella sp. NM4]|uniref:GntR family transcriptional regulator n=1 Tax=Brucella sp. NM4 TaxID=3045175 RepID=UPI0024BC880B|nr:GntR family transcriptional regulator [Brucella sp. NM4]WHS30610.1 GntR family transcriptional regulator [Brucella sp. NM4]